MSRSKRIVLLIFCCATLISSAALALCWFGPLTVQATNLMHMHIYSVVVEALLACVICGVLCLCIYAVFAPSSKKYTAMQIDGSYIEITREAIASCVAQTIRDFSSCEPTRIRVHITKRKVTIQAKIAPTQTFITEQVGQMLHNKIVEALNQLCVSAQIQVTLTVLPQKKLAQQLESDSYDTSSAQGDE